MRTKRFYVLAIAVIFFSQLLINSGCKKENNNPAPQPQDTTRLLPQGLVPATESEFLSVPTALPGDTTFVPYLKGAVVLPDSSWVDVPSPSHEIQKYLNCTSWTVGYGILSYYFKFYEGHKDYNWPNLDRVFSPSYIHNQLLNGGPDRGFSFPTVFGLVINQGCCKASYMPLIVDLNILPSTTAILNASNYKMSEFVKFPSLDIDLMKSYIARGHPLAVGMVVDKAFCRLPEKAGTFEVYDNKKIWKKYTDTSFANHAMVICGYNNRINAFKLLNSWGDTWGDHGYIWVDYDFFKEAVMIGNFFPASPEIYLCYIKRPVLLTTDVNTITNTTAQCGGNITGDWGVPVTERGVCWNIFSEPTISNNKTSDGTGMGNYSSNLIGLIVNTKYYVKAYAVNETGVSYGTEVSFTTGNNPVSPATVTTSTASNITTTGATLGGNVTNDGNAAVTDRGIVYSTSPNPTTANTKVSIGSGTGSFSSNITGLTAGTKYYFKAYAINSQGTAYGNEENFTCSLVVSPATVTTSTASNITTTGATLGGNVTNDGNAAVIDRGIVYYTSPNPTTANTKVSIGSGTGSFSSNISGLSAGTKYYFKAYAINSQGTAYGSEENFTCSLILSPATVTTSTASNITTTGATLGGNVTNDGNAAVTDRGIVYSTSPNPTTANTKVSIGSGTGSFSSNITGLTAGTKYYFKAYAINSQGTVYGSEENFTCSLILSPATVATSTESNVTATGATLGGNVTSDGNTPVTERGIVYATTHNPTTSDTKIAVGNGTGIFSSNINGLTPNTPYYVRAYAINSQGTAYGVEISFTTSSSSTFSIGQSYGGGVIFYIDNTGQHGLIAATSDQSTSIQWYNPNFVLTGATGKVIGTGQSNTDKIVATLGNGSYAAKLCYDLSLGGYDDWFLPSEDELIALFNLTGPAALIETGYYWGSTETGGTGLGSGACQFQKYFHSYVQSGVARVRAIRAF